MPRPFSSRDEKSLPAATSHFYLPMRKFSGIFFCFFFWLFMPEISVHTRGEERNSESCIKPGKKCCHKLALRYAPHVQKSLLVQQAHTNTNTYTCCTLGLFSLPLHIKVALLVIPSRHGRADTVIYISQRLKKLEMTKSTRALCSSLHRLH